MAAKILEIINLEKKYGDKFKLNIDYLSLEENKILVIIGPNGAGKSTLIRLINLLEKPDCGSVIFDGVEIYKDGYGRSYQVGVKQNYKDSLKDGYIDGTEDCVKDGLKYGWKSYSNKVFSSGFPGKTANEVEVRRKMAVVFQEPLLFNASVYDNIVLGLKIRGKKISQVKDRFQYLVEKLKISHLLYRSAKTLSGGEQQRVSLTRALILEPRLLLLDEPLANIDQPSREKLRADFFGLVKSEKRSTIYVTHDRNEAMMLADYVAVLNKGKIEQFGLRDEVFRRPKNEFVAEFVGVETLLEGVVESCEDNVCVVSVNRNLTNLKTNPNFDMATDGSTLQARTIIGKMNMDVNMDMKINETMSTNSSDSPDSNSNSMGSGNDFGIDFSSGFGNSFKVFAVGKSKKGFRVVLSIRPEDVILYSIDDIYDLRSIDRTTRATSAMNLFPGKILEIKDVGVFKKVEIDCGFNLVSFVTQNSIERLDLKVGKPVLASVKASSIHFFEK